VTVLLNQRGVQWQVLRDRRAGAWVAVCDALQLTVQGESWGRLLESIDDTVVLLLKDLNGLPGHLWQKLFDLEFCAPGEKAARERVMDTAFTEASRRTNTPLYVLKPAVLKTYPLYRLGRLDEGTACTVPPGRKGGHT